MDNVNTVAVMAAFPDPDTRRRAPRTAYLSKSFTTFPFHERMTVLEAEPPLTLSQLPLLLYSSSCNANRK